MRKFSTNQFKTFEQDEGDVLDYIHRAERFLDGDTISTSTWEADSGITIGSDSNDTTTATVWLSGGTSGDTYIVTNRIVTAGGRTKEAYMKVQVINPQNGRKRYIY